MDRAEWLAQRRRAVVEWYDADAPRYETHAYPIEHQRRWVSRLVDLAPPGGLVLDVPCGTGRYFDIVVGAGRQVVGVDQSAGMLAEAARRGLATRLEHSTLADLAFHHEFDAVMTVDAMENVPPEDWPVVLANLRRAVRPGGPLYVTVEDANDTDLDATFASLTARGVPAVRGEVVSDATSGYHYYPGRDRVLSWLADAGLAVVDEGYQQEDGWGYLHLLLRGIG